jgi:PAS domain S-box-containing protein
MNLEVWQRYSRFNRVVPYLLAAFLSIVSTTLTFHIEALHAGTYALHFVVMVVVAVLGGLWPSLAYIFFTVIGMHYLAPHPAAWLPVSAIDVVRPGTLTAAALVLGLLLDMQRKTSDALEQALANLQIQSAALVESQQASKCASWTYDANDRTRWFAGGYEVFGLPFAELEALPSPIDLIFVEDQPAVRKAVARMVSGTSQLHVEYRTLWPNGELHWSEARGNPVPDQPNLWRGITFDITERKLAEIALIQNEKLAAMGRLASTVAHEINNPLEAVTNLLYLARRDNSLRPATEAHLALAEKELARLGNITRLTLGFVRNSLPRSDVDMANVVEEVLSIFNHRLKMKNIRVERRYQLGVLIEIAPHELRQIVVNLISNATDAASLADATLSVRVELQQEHAVLLVEDNGSGIARHHIERVFDPFFSTKDDVGTGIGLWVTRELVEKNGGRITVRSGELPGDVRTSFRIQFPLPAALQPVAVS